MAADDSESKLPEQPVVLILGGCGFIGRHMVQHLIICGGVSKIIVADKRAPMTSYFSQSMHEVFKDDKVEFKQCDLSRQRSIDHKNLFNEHIDYIINLCGETRFGQTELDYQTKCVDSAKLCIAQAENLSSLKKWIEISTAQVYDGSDNVKRETSAIAPYTKMASFRFQVEEILRSSKLPHVILRPSTVYGPADQTGLTPRLVVAAGYKLAREKMVLLWSKSVKLNTVHVTDLCNAMWVACTDIPTGRVYNFSDPSNTTIGDINELLKKLFGIKCGFQNALMNAAASKMMDYAARVSNEKHMPMWAKACKAGAVKDTPLSPYLDIEILSKKHLRIDGSAITKDFKKIKYRNAKVTVELLEEIISDFVAGGYFPDLAAL